jgi:hypothetical protein
VQVRRRDVVEVGGPDDADAKVVKTRTHAAQLAEVGDLEDRHVAAVAATIDEAARGRARLVRRHDLEEVGADLVHGVVEAEGADTRVGVGIAQADVAFERIASRGQVAGDQGDLPEPSGSGHGERVWRLGSWSTRPRTAQPSPHDNRSAREAQEDG